MTSTVDRRHRAVARLGAVGAALGVVAGIVQATVGTRIPDWTGAKAAPVALGLLTIALSLLAGLAAVGQRRDLTVGVRAAAAFGLLVPGLVCFSTVGRLWYLPGPLLLVAAVLTIDSWRATAAHLARNWIRCLLSVLGASELLMAAGATPTLMVVGAVGGVTLLTAAWLPGPRRWTLIALLAIATVPFAALAWTAIVPVLLLLTTTAVAAPLIHNAGTRTRLRDKGW